MLNSLLAAKNFLSIIVLVFLIGFIVFYIIAGFILNSLNKRMNGKGTPMAWIPITNIYLLGKLTVNKLVGWLLVVGLFVTTKTTTTVNGVSTTSSILPSSIASMVSNIYYLLIFGLFIYAIVKLVKLKKVAKEGIANAPVNNMGSQPIDKPIEQTNNEINTPFVAPVIDVATNPDIQPLSQSRFSMGINNTAQPVVTPTPVNPVDSLKQIDQVDILKTESVDSNNNSFIKPMQPDFNIEMAKIDEPVISPAPVSPLENISTQQPSINNNINQTNNSFYMPTEPSMTEKNEQDIYVKPAVEDDEILDLDEPIIQPQSSTLNSATTVANNNIEQENTNNSFFN